MIRRILVALVSITLLSGCAQVRHVDVDSSEGAFRDINRIAAGHEVSIELADGSILTGIGATVEQDSTRLHESQGATWGRVVGTSDVRKITVFGRGLSARHGAKVGALSGGASGAAIGLIFLRDMQDAGPLEYTVLLAGAATAVGAVVGLCTGFFAGNETVFEFPLPPRAPRGR